ncbi:hypothetical protein SCA6_002264 [Theobroma cacao]
MSIQINGSFLWEVGHHAALWKVLGKAVLGGSKIHEVEISDIGHSSILFFNLSCEALCNFGTTEGWIIKLSCTLLTQ